VHRELAVANLDNDLVEDLLPQQRAEDRARVQRGAGVQKQGPPLLETKRASVVSAHHADGTR
jgi:hypothetical protein